MIYNITNTEKNIRSFIKDINRKGIKYLGLDFEFIHNRISMIQMSIHYKNNNVIWLIDPILSDFLIDLLTNVNIIKITHGSESLDFPYLFNEVLTTNEEIKNFILSSYDTRYLCDFSKVINNKNVKCSLYDSLRYMNIITDEEYTNLNNKYEKLGKIYDVDWDINNIKKKYADYAAYDVLHLKQLFLCLSKDIYSKGKQLLEDSINIYRLITGIKYGITALTNIRKIVNKYNCYFIINDDKRVSFIDIYNEKINTIVYSKINYFKKIFEAVVKYIVYSKLFLNETVYKSKNEIETSDININILKKECNKLGFDLPTILENI